MSHAITTAELEDLTHNPDGEIRCFAREVLAERMGAVGAASRRHPETAVKLVAEENRIDRTLPDDGSEVAALRRALALVLPYVSWPEEVETWEDECFAVTSLLENDRNDEDTAIIAAGLARRDVDHGPDLEALRDEYQPEMSEPELRAWGAKMAEVADLAMWQEAATRRDHRGASARIHRAALEMQREAYQMAA